MAWVPGSRSKFGNWTSVPSLYSWNIAECDVKPQSTTTTTIKIQMAAWFMHNLMILGVLISTWATLRSHWNQKQVDPLYIGVTENSPYLTRGRRLSSRNSDTTSLSATQTWDTTFDGTGGRPSLSPWQRKCEERRVVCAEHLMVTRTMTSKQTLDVLWHRLLILPLLGKNRQKSARVSAVSIFKWYTVNLF